ncbi:KH domain-containing protein [Chlamydia avium]|uniref:RNA-binding protein KhpA n=1 Tax=Chlamydia avium TaxID=1457141 RepID=A0ABP2X7D3_9CHLA|nr:KH domain-containing protein [Chlamydia avium]EPP38725.1 KH domain protein [Chlamydia avium]
MEEFVAYIVKNLVANPEAVEIRSIQDETGESIKLEVRVSPDDIGKIIGRRGSTIHALRTILRRVCSRLKKKVQIDLVQPEGTKLPSDETEEDCCDFNDLDMESQCCHESGSCCSSHQEEEPQDMSSVHHECSYHGHGCCE